METLRGIIVCRQILSVGRQWFLVFVPCSSPHIVKHDARAYFYCNVSSAYLHIYTYIHIHVYISMYVASCHLWRPRASQGYSIEFWGSGPGFQFLGARGPSTGPGPPARDPGLLAWSPGPRASLRRVGDPKPRLGVPSLCFGIPRLVSGPRA